jgi:hypothetical protein
MSGAMGAVLASNGQVALAESAGLKTPAAARIVRVLVSVPDNDSLDKELKFWKDAVKMKILNEKKDADGNRAALVGFGPEFALEVRVDPSVLKRARPKLLNYDAMQPTVDALSYLQMGAVGKSMEIFAAVQNAGGAALYGDASYLDAESPRGVPVRMIAKGVQPAVELISFNVEVPAFESTLNFYKRGLGLKELRYPDDGPPIVKLSKLLASDIGGPNLLITPVPDGRLKDRKLDEFEGVVMVSPAAKAFSTSAAAAIEIAAKEEAQKLAELRAAQSSDSEFTGLKKYLAGTRAAPSMSTEDGTIRIDDGVGNILFVQDQANYEATAV